MLGGLALGQQKFDDGAGVVPVDSISSAFDFSLDTSQVVAEQYIFSDTTSDKYLAAPGVTDGKLPFAFPSALVGGLDFAGDLITHPDGWIQPSIDNNSILTSAFTLTGTNSWVASLKVIIGSSASKIASVTDSDGVYISVRLSSGSLTVTLDATTVGVALIALNQSQEYTLSLAYNSVTGILTAFIDGVALPYFDGFFGDIGANKSLTGGQIFLGAKITDSGSNNNKYSKGFKYKNPKMYSAPNLPADIDAAILELHNTGIISDATW